MTFHSRLINAHAIETLNRLLRCSPLWLCSNDRVEKEVRVLYPYLARRRVVAQYDVRVKMSWNQLLRMSARVQECKKEEGE